MSKWTFRPRSGMKKEHLLALLERQLEHAKRLEAQLKEQDDAHRWLHTIALELEKGTCEDPRCVVLRRDAAHATRRADRFAGGVR